MEGIRKLVGFKNKVRNYELLRTLRGKIHFHNILILKWSQTSFKNNLL